MRLLLNLVGVGLLVASAYACGAQEVTFMREGMGHVEITHQKYAVDGAGALTVDTDFGSVRVESGPNDEVDVEVEKHRTGISEDSARDAFDDVSVEISRQENDVDIRIERDRRLGSNDVSVDIQVKVPESYNLDLKTSGGDIDVGDLGGDVLARTSGGDVNVGNITDAVIRVHTSGGDVNVKGGGTETKVSTSGGDIEILDARGAVDASTSGGDVTIGNAAGEVSAKTSGGDIEARMRAAVSVLEEDWLLQSSGGELAIHIPEDLPATLEAEIRLERSWFGREEEYRIDSDFDLDEQNEETRNRRTIRATGDINGGGSRIRLITSGGDIRIRKGSS